MTAAAKHSAAPATGRHRLFFALVPDSTVQRQIHTVQQQLDCEGRSVQPANLHVTLAFLGMHEAAVIPAVRAVAAGMQFPACRVELDCVGQFGRGRVLWLGARQVPEALNAFQAGLVTALTRAGIGHDPKPWQLHLTLYRRLRKSPPRLDSVSIGWDLRGFDLVESVGARSGVEYHSIGHWPARA